MRRVGSTPSSRTTQGKHAKVAELVDALDSKSSELKTRVGSSPTFGTIHKASSAYFTHLSSERLA